MRFEIKSRFSGAVLFAIETDSLRLAVELAVKARADLADANLAGANLAGANLAGADLADANLAGANLAGANLAGAYLARAYLARADLARAYLADANLAGADLAGADLAGAYLARAYLARAKLRSKDGRDLALVGARPCLQIGPIGSRHDHMAAFVTDAGAYVRAGCFWGTLDAFRRAVAETHGGGSVARIEYDAAIAMVDVWARANGHDQVQCAPAEPAEAQS